jgi:hypothetical protein
MRPGGQWAKTHAFPNRSRETENVMVGSRFDGRRAAALSLVSSLFAVVLTTGVWQHPAFAAAPTPKPDSYSTPVGTLLTVRAPGVLANDSDPDGDPLTAGMPTAPAHGTLNLSSDGSFTYKPTAGFSGTDTFTYMAHDGTGGMVTAGVTITVGSGGGGNPSTLAVKDVSVTEGAPGTTKTAAFKITRSGSTAGAASVNVTTANGTATAPSDYKAVAPKTVSLAAGVATTTVKVKVVGDSLKESNETFSLVLSSPTGATISDGTGVATVVNDD